MILEQLKLDKPKTKEMAQILAALQVDSSALIVTREAEDSIIKSACNLPGIRIIPVNLLNVVDILSYKMLLMTEVAVRKAEEIWGEKLSQGENDASL